MQMSLPKVGRIASFRIQNGGHLPEVGLRMRCRNVVMQISLSRDFLERSHWIEQLVVLSGNAENAG